MKFISNDLINELQTSTKRILAELETYKSYSIDQLNCREKEGSWSILECIEHLSLYGDFYIPEIGSRIANSKHQAKASFKSGVLGNYFANSMLPKENLKPMKTFVDKDPIGSSLDLTVIDRFIGQQKEMLVLLEKSKMVSLAKTKVSITISKVLKLKLGDTLRFVVYHNQRHMIQAKKLVN